jgi:hypothetical protein
MGTIVGFSPEHLLWSPTHICSEHWRYTGPFSRFNRFKGSFPGLGIATVAFGAYLAAEQFGLIKDEGGHHDETG